MKSLQRTDIQFLELLKAGLWGTVPNTALFEGETDWEAIVLQARRQAVSPIVFDGLERLSKELHPAQQLKFQWYGDVVQAERQNALLNKTVVKLVERFSAIGLTGVIIKGQSLTRYYRQPEHRIPGDIDIYFKEGYMKANEQAQKWTSQIYERDIVEQEWRHQFCYTLPNDVIVENHKECALYFSRKRMATWKEIEHLTMGDSVHTFSIGDVAIPTLSPTLNAIFVFQHLLRHLLFFGVGFRQVCDWVLLFKHELPNIDLPLFLESIDRLELRRAMTALTLLAEQYLGIEKGLFPFDTLGEKVQEDATIMLNELLAMGNFGHDTTLSKDKESGSLIRKLNAYGLLFKRIFLVSRFGSREVFGIVRNTIEIYCKKCFRSLKNRCGKTTR